MDNFIDNGNTYDSKYYKLVGDKLEEVVQPTVEQTPPMTILVE